MKRALITLLAAASAFAAEPEFPLTADSKPQPGVAKGTMIKGTYTAKDGSVFPGTVREYQLYLPAGFDKSKPAPFMVFQDGVIYQAPVVFDNLIVKKDIPLLVGLFIKPGVVPAANDNALPRFNRSYEYDSVTDTYSRFLIEEFLPAIEAEHGLQLSTDPNHAAIAGNSSGGICAFMAAWHRPDRFRRVFTGVGTYVGIRGADRLPVLVRKIEPKPLRVFLQSGTGDNDLYCGDWWMANQMMQRSLAWAGYDVHHAWGEGGHNQKHASQVFPDAMRWLWRDWQTDMEIKANPKGESKWKGYEVVGAGEWTKATQAQFEDLDFLVGDARGAVLGVYARRYGDMGSKWIVVSLSHTGELKEFMPVDAMIFALAPWKNGFLYATNGNVDDAGISWLRIDEWQNSKTKLFLNGSPWGGLDDFVVRYDGSIVACQAYDHIISYRNGKSLPNLLGDPPHIIAPHHIAVSPDQTTIYASDVRASKVVAYKWNDDGKISHDQLYVNLEAPLVPNFVGRRHGLCVDTNGWLYVATSIGIQVCDQAGRVNFIIPTPQPAYDVCFGGKDLSELFIACGDTIYKRPTKARGVVSGQQAPIKPAPPKL